MRKTTYAPLLLVAAIAMPGCGDPGPPAAPAPLTLTEEQSEAIAREDSRIQGEEGGAFLSRLAKSKKK